MAITRAWIHQWDANHFDLVALLGEQAVQQRQAERRAQLHAIEDGILTRSLFTARRPYPASAPHRRSLTGGQTGRARCPVLLAGPQPAAGGVAPGAGLRGYGTRRKGLPAGRGPSGTARCSTARAVRRQVSTPPGSVYADAKTRERQRRHGVPRLQLKPHYLASPPDRVTPGARPARAVTGRADRRLGSARGTAQAMRLARADHPFS